MMHVSFWQFLLILKNTLATFCNLMNDLYEYLDDFVMVYLDDIAIYSRSVRDHIIHISKFK
jgi:hypothetical protein